MQAKLREDLKRLASSYEDRVRKMVHDFDLKSREARENSLKQFDKFAVQLRKTRGNVEKRVTALLNEEGKRLNEAVTELFQYLKSMSKDEKIAQKGASKKKPSKARLSETGTKKRSRKKSTAGASPAASQTAH